MELLKSEWGNRRKLSDSDVVKRIIGGEKELFEILLRRHNQMLYRAIRSYITDQAEIKDLMQNTYLKSFEELDQFKHNAAFSTWLIRIGINECLGKLRKKERFQSIDDTEINKELSTIVNMKGQLSSDPEKEMMRMELRRTIEKAVDSLDSKYKSVYILREVEGMTSSQVANCLGISIVNVKVRNHRAKALLRGHLNQLTQINDLFEFGFSHCDRMVEEVMKRIL
jgi:RNA polymerase sigma factor (sigma-70 family)